MVIICDLPGEGDFLSLELWLNKGKSSVVYHKNCLPFNHLQQHSFQILTIWKEVDFIFL
jgi:hypothetical protein